MVKLCKSYFNGEFGEDQVRKNFALIYELLDEVMDFGYPQIVDPDLLKMYITQGKQANPNLNVSANMHTKSCVEHREVEIDHDPGNRRHFLACRGHQIQEKRGLHRYC
jgi:hypothetical protein